MNLAEMQEKRGRLVNQAREALDEIKSNTDESRAAELEERHDKIMGEFDQLEATIAREERVAQLEAENEQRAEEERARQRPKGEDRGTKGVEEGEKATHDQAFDAFLRHGMNEMPSELRQIMRENRAQSVGTDSAGGYSVPQGFLAELVKSMKMWGPMLDPGVTRELVTASGNQIEIPTMDDTSNTGYRLAENTTTTNEGDLVMGQKLLDAYKYASGPILVSSELLQDSAFDVDALVRDAMAERIARKVNADLTTGDGVGDPNGIVTASSAGNTSASGTAVSFDDLIELVHSVDPAYRVNGTCQFMFEDATLKLLRKIKDSNSNYIWQPANVQTGAPSSILGHGYVVNQDVASVAVNAKAVLFGDFSKYVVRRVKEIAIRRLDERYAEFDQVGFIGFARFDGELLDTGAVKHLLQAAA